MRKQTVSFLLSLVLLLNLLPLTALAGDWSGSCGTRVTWSLDRETGILAFEGSGKISEGYLMRDSLDVCWWPRSDLIREIRFSDGITAIGAGVFDMLNFASYSEVQRMRNVRTVLVPASIEQIGADAFYSLTRLDEITILNPKCWIETSQRTLGIPGRTVVVGYPASTAEAYALQSGYEFRPISCADGAHVYNDTVVTPQTCTQDGVMESECVICHAKTRRPIPAGHDYAVTESLARTVYTCTRCGDSYVAGECRRMKLEETLKFTVNAGAYPCFSFTPEKTDLYSFYLMETGAWEPYGNTEAPGTIYDSAGEIVAKGMSQAVLKAGRTYYYRLTQVYDDALEVSIRVMVFHNFEQTSGSATCTQAGTVTETCTYCGESRTEETGPLGHFYEQTVLTAPTCTQEGLARCTCLRCGRSYTEAIPAAHQYLYDVTLPWYSHAVCRVCGEVYSQGTPDPAVIEPGKAAAAHFEASESMCFFRFTPDRTEGYEFRANSKYADELMLLDQDGKTLDTAYAYSLAIRQELEAGETYYLGVGRRNAAMNDFPVSLELVHAYRVTESVPASCSAEGSITYVCSCCGDVYTEAIPETHTWKYDVELPWYQHAVCTRCGKVGEFGTKTPPAIALGECVVPQIGEKSCVFYSFTPEKNDVYSFWFTESTMDRLALYDTDGMELCWSDESVRTDIAAGQTVILQVIDMDSSTDSPPVQADVVHNYLRVETAAPTCTEEGQMVGLCRFCGDYIIEAIPPTHSIEYEVALPWYWRGACTVCGQTVEEGSMTPPEIRSGETHTAQIEVAGEGVFRRFTPEKSGYYRFAFPDPDCYFEFWTADGKEMLGNISYNDYAGYEFEAAFFAGQTYYIYLGHSNSSETGEISVTLSQLDEFTISEIKPGQRGSVQINDPDHAAFFRFTAGQAGYYEFSSDSPEDVQPKAGLLDAAGSEMDCVNRLEDGEFKVRFWLDAGQTCVLEARIMEGIGGKEEYSLLLRQVEEAVESRALKPNRIETAHIRSFDDADYFRFTPEESGYYEFLSRSDIDTVCALYDAEMKWLDYSDDGPSDGNFLLNAYLEAGQTYYFAVSSYSGQICDFSVILRYSRNWSWPDYYWEGLERVVARCYDIDNPEIVVSETVQTTCVVVKEPTYSSEGSAIYVATFKNNRFDTVSRIASIPMLPMPELPCDGEDCPGGSFRDMPARDHWAHDAIDWALVMGITTGTSREKFSPDSGCTRAQVATFLWRAAGEPMPRAAYNPFTDVSPDDYYYEAVLWALGEGITTGTSEERFSPDAVCTRAQIVTFLWRFDGCEEPDQSAAFSDVSAGAYYEKAVAWAREKGVTTGTGGGKFSPDATCTRAQVVTFLHRHLAS